MKNIRAAACILTASAVLSSSTPALFAAGRSEAPRLQALETNLFKGPNSLPAALDAFPNLAQDDAQRTGLELILRAATANPYAAGDLLFNSGLDEASAAAAARTVLKIRERADGDAALAKTLESLQTKVWDPEELAQSDNEGLRSKQAGALADFKTVLAAARGQNASLEEAVRLWKTGYEGAAKSAAATTDAIDLSEGASAPPSAASLHATGLSSKRPQVGDKVPSPASSEDASRVSSWNFAVAGNLFNLPGKGRFIDELKTAVEKSAKADWQGPSFDAHAWALSRENTAKEVMYQTKIPAAELLEGMAYLRDQGYFRFIPPAGNVRPGIDAKEIDRIAAEKLGADAPVVLNADGTKNKALHLFGYSSNDRMEFDAAYKALSKEVKKGRWENVKITLFYTGENQKDLTSGAYVITSKGDLRGITADEYGEGYIEQIESPGSFSKPKFKPIPYAKVRRAKLKTIGDAIVKMWVSHPFKTSFDKVEAGADLLAVEREAARALILNKSIPDDLKELPLTRYSIDDEKTADVLILAKQKGIPAPFTTDFNVSMDFKFSEGMHAITDFRNIKPKNDPAGRFIQKLLDAGYVIAGPGIELTEEQKKWAIYSQPMYNKGDAQIDPIMHEKSWLLVVKEDLKRGVKRKIDFYFGTANMTDHQRYNRLFLINEENAAEYAYRHFDKIAKAFTEGKTIAEIESEPPIRIYAEDDSYAEFAFTNGQYNLNDRKIGRYERALKDPQSYQLIKSVRSQFAPTLARLYDLLKEVLKTFKDATVWAIGDRGFAGTTGYGKTAQMKGSLLLPEFGKIAWGWNFDLMKRVTLKIWIKQAQGKDGKPQPNVDVKEHHLTGEIWHDKTAIEWWRERLRALVEQFVTWVYVDTGSLNESGHADNAELQAVFRFPADSPWAQAIEDSIVKVVEANPQYAIDHDPGVLQLELAHMLGHNDYEIKGASLKAIEEAISGGKPKDIAALKAELEKIKDSATDLRKNMHSKEVVEENIRKFVDFIDWYYNKLPQELEKTGGLHPGKLWYNKVVALVDVVGHPEFKPFVLKRALGKIMEAKVLYDHPEQLEKLIAMAWEKLEIKEPMPGPREPKDDSKAPPEGGKKPPRGGGRRRAPAKP